MLYNEFDITVSYSVKVTSTGVPPGKDKSGQVIEPAEGIDYEIESFRIGDKDFPTSGPSLAVSVGIGSYLEIVEQIEKHARENIESMIEEETC